MKYHALFVIFEKQQNLKLSSAAKIGGALRAKDQNLIRPIAVRQFILETLHN